MRTSSRPSLGKPAFYRQFWQKQGTVVAGNWAWLANASQTNYSSVTAEGAGNYTNYNGGVGLANLDEYKWSNIFLSIGNYKLSFVTANALNWGIQECLFGSASLGTTDCYSAATIYNVAVSYSFTITKSMTADLRFRVNGKNASSSNYITGFSLIYLEKIG